jgi:hypothetical protein
MSVLFLRNLRVECRWEPFVVRKWFRHFCFSLNSGWNEPNPFQREITVRRTRATPCSAAHFFVVQPRENWICAQVRHTDRTERERWVLRPDYRVCVCGQSAPNARSTWSHARQRERAPPLLSHHLRFRCRELSVGENESLDCAPRACTHPPTSTAIAHQQSKSESIHSNCGAARDDTRKLINLRRRLHSFL